MPNVKRTVRRPWIPEHKAFEGFKHHNSEFYQSRTWRKARANKLQLSPLCEECLRHGRTTEATMVDHIIPINKGGDPLALDNLQSLCHSCHSIKSAKDK